MDPRQEEKKDFPLDVLSHLEQLESQQRGCAEAQEHRERLQERKKFLKSQILELRNRRDRLRERLRLLELGKSGIPSDPREILEWKIRNCRERLRLFRLTGISGTLSPHGVSVSLHSSFQGSLLDPFHLQLESRESQEFRELRLGRHSIPPFIPLERLARERLPQDPPGFLGMLSQQLSAFRSRREQIRKVQEEFPEWVELLSQNSLCNLLSLRYRIPTGNSRKFREFRARLRYGDPRRSLPGDGDVTAATADGIPVPEHAELLRRLPLHRALAEIRTRETTGIITTGIKTTGKKPEKTGKTGMAA